MKAEEVNNIQRGELYNEILEIVNQIPRKDVEGDSMDAYSAAHLIDLLFSSRSVDEMRIDALWKYHCAKARINDDAYQSEIMLPKAFKSILKKLSFPPSGFEAGARLRDPEYWEELYNRFMPDTKNTD